MTCSWLFARSYTAAVLRCLTSWCQVTNAGTDTCWWKPLPGSKGRGCGQGEAITLLWGQSFSKEGTGKWPMRCMQICSLFNIHTLVSVQQVLLFHQSSQFVSKSCNLWHFAACSQTTAYLHCTDQYGHCCMPVTSLSTGIINMLNVVHRVQSKPLYDCLAKRYLPDQVVKATQLTAEKVCFEVCNKNQWSCYLEAAACALLQHRRRGKWNGQCTRCMSWSSSSATYIPVS